MAKQKKNEHMKICVHLEQVKRDQARNATYTSKTGCDIDADNVGGGGAAAVINHCKWAKYECSGDRAHKTERSQKYKFTGKIKEFIIGKIFIIFNSVP